MRSHNLRNSVQIAVIGGNSFLGRAIIHRLSSYYNLRIFSLDPNPYKVAINTEGEGAIIEQITLDVCNESAIRSWLISRPVDIIIYAAGIENITDGLAADSLKETSALVGLHNVLSSISNMDLESYEDLPYFMLVSSWTVYGPQKKNKLSTENTIETPANHTGMHRLVGEDLTRRFCSKYSIPFSILRPTEVYGKLHHKELGNLFSWPGYLAYYAERILRKQSPLEVFSPKTKLDLVNINYFTKVVVELLKDKTEGTFNIASGNTITIEELVKTISFIYGEPTDLVINKSHPLKIEDMAIDPSKAHKLVPYDGVKYQLESFIKAYLPARRYEIAKGMAIENILTEPVTLDMASVKAMEAYEKRSKKRLIEYNKIKEVAGGQFFNLKLGRIQERTKEFLGEKYEVEKLEAEKKEKELEKDKLSLLLEDESITGTKVIKYNTKEKLLAKKK